MSGFPFWRASSSQRERWLNVSLRVMSYTCHATRSAQAKWVRSSPTHTFLSLNAAHDRADAHQKRARRAAVVTACDGPEALLSRRVPNLQLDILVFDLDHARSELNADSEIVYGLEALVCELQEQA